MRRDLRGRPEAEADVSCIPARIGCLPSGKEPQAVGVKRAQGVGRHEVSNGAMESGRHLERDPEGGEPFGLLAAHAGRPDGEKHRARPAALEHLVIMAPWRAIGVEVDDVVLPFLILEVAQGVELEPAALRLHVEREVVADVELVAQDTPERFRSGETIADGERGAARQLAEELAGEASVWRLGP